MSSNASYRLSGIALLSGGILSVVYYVTQSFGSDTDIKTLTSSLFLISSIIGFIGSLLALLGLPGVYIRQAKQAGILGLLGFLGIAYVILMQGVLIPFTSITIVPFLASNSNPALQALATSAPPAMEPFFLVSLAGQTLGILLLAIATLRARVFPRWIAWLLIATLIGGLLSFLPALPPLLESLAPVIASVALVGFGSALLQSQRSAAAQPASVSTNMGARV
ncbi:MAG: hypothetical protein J2P36_01440 [Ktedonobacteraceae bacterium]|nr:hypothetical protein [Ktedonobacteraceae bacterium]